MINKGVTGVICHISSLPGHRGIGDIGDTAFKFIDYISGLNISLWQILPITDCGTNYCPYEPMSSFAGNILFISIDKLIVKGYLDPNDEYVIVNNERVNYEEVHKKKYSLFRKAFIKFIIDIDDDFKSFCDENEWWLNDYSQHMTTIEKNVYDSYAMNASNVDHQIDYDTLFYKFLQYEFFSQWKELRAYALTKGVSIIGDVPFYVPLESVDVKTFSSSFLLNEQGKEVGKPGGPPDHFNEAGQLWGGCLYDWKKLKDLNYEYLVLRVKYALELFDYVRLDHFRGLIKYWFIPIYNLDPACGEWREGPGSSFLDTLVLACDRNRLLVEDLGIITDDVKRMKDKYNLKGMSVIQDCNSSEEVHKFLTIDNDVLYTGTHDYVPLKGWLDQLDEEVKHELCSALCLEKIEPLSIIESLSSQESTVIFQVQDLLQQGTDHVMNIPGTRNQRNWRYRISDNILN